MSTSRRKLIFLTISAIILIPTFVFFTVFFSITPCEPPQFTVWVRPSNTGNFSTEHTALPTVHSYSASATARLATFDDQVCIEVAQNPAGTSTLAFFSLIQPSRPSLPHCYTGHDLLTFKKPSTTLQFSAQNRAGRTDFHLNVSWLDDCGRYDLIYDEVRHFTICDERALVNYTLGHGGAYPSDYHPSPSSSSTTAATSSSTTTSASTSTTTTAPSTTPSGLSRATAERLCARRLERQYELSSVLSATISGDSWLIELEGDDNDSPAGRIIYAECHVSGTNSSPAITYYYEDAYEDYYYDDDAGLQYCHYGYDYATGTCR